MSRSCDLCNKGVTVINNISHKHSGKWAKRAPKTKRKILPNLRVLNLDTENNKVNIKVCMRCYRTLNSSLQ